MRAALCHGISDTAHLVLTFMPLTFRDATLKDVGTIAALQNAERSAVLSRRHARFRVVSGASPAQRAYGVIRRSAPSWLIILSVLFPPSASTWM